MNETVHRRRRRSAAKAAASLSACGLLGLWSASSAHGQIVTNGGFENTSGFTNAQRLSLQANGYLTVAPVNSVTIQGWTVVNNPLATPGSSNLDVVNSTFLVHNGNLALDLVGTGAGSALGALQQNVTLGVGLYQLSFYVAHFTGTAASGTNYLSVALAGTSLGTQNIGLPAASGTWRLVTINFSVTTANNYTLSFAALQALASNSGAYLDDVSITVIPEPAALWAGGISLLALGHGVYRRRRGRRLPGRS